MTLTFIHILPVLITGFAAVVHGAVGIGFPLIATPLLAMVTDVKTAILLLVVPTIAINLANIIKGGKWQKSIALYWPLAVYGMIGSFLGARLLVAVPPENFRPVLAGVILLYLNADRLGVGFSWVPRYPRTATALFGLAAGILGGTVNVMLPALVIFALEIRMDKTAMIQVFNFCFLFGKLTQGLVFVQAGFLTLDVIKTSIPLAVLSLVAMVSAMTLRTRIRGDVYKRWLRRLLLIMAVVLLSQFFYGMVVKTV